MLCTAPAFCRIKDVEGSNRSKFEETAKASVVGVAESYLLIGQFRVLSHQNKQRLLVDSYETQNYSNRDWLNMPKCNIFV